MTIALFKPSRVLRGRLGVRHPVRRAALFLIGAGLLYALTSAGLAVSGAVPTAPVLFGMDVDNYYFWQMVLTVPLIVAIWLLCAGILLAPGIGHPKDDSPRRTSALAVAAWALGGPLLVAWVPSAVQAVLMILGMGQEEWVSILSDPGPWQTAFLAFYIGAAALAARDFIIAARLVHPKSWPRAVPAGIAAAAVVVGAFAALVR